MLSDDDDDGFLRYKKGEGLKIFSYGKKNSYGKDFKKIL